MTSPDPRQDPEGIALIEGILHRIGYRGADSAAPMADLGPIRELVSDIARTGRAMGQLLGFEPTVEQLVLLIKIGAIQPARRASSVERIKKRQAALAAKKHQGKGPPSSASWRGRERNPKYRSQ